MTNAIVANQAERISDRLISDLLADAAPDLEDDDVYIKALAELLRPALSQVLQAYRMASATHSTELAFRAFVINLASGG